MKEILYALTIVLFAIAIIKIDHNIGVLARGNECVRTAKIWIDTEKVYVYSPEYRQSVEDNFVSNCK